MNAVHEPKGSAIQIIAKNYVIARCASGTNYGIFTGKTRSKAKTKLAAFQAGKNFLQCSSGWVSSSVVFVATAKSTNAVLFVG